MSMTKAITTYKGFNPDMTCRGYQFKLGRSFRHGEPVIPCESGFHACPAPLATLKYYPPHSSIYCKVFQSGALQRCEDKVASSEITIHDRLSLHQLGRTHVDWVQDNLNFNCCALNDANKEGSTARALGVTSCASSTGYRSLSVALSYASISAATGGYSAAQSRDTSSISATTAGQSSSETLDDVSISAATGWNSAAVAGGVMSVAANSGNGAIAATNHNFSVATCTGYDSASESKGRFSASVSVSDKSIATSHGFSSLSATVGSQSVAKVTGDNSVAVSLDTKAESVATGYGGTAVSTGYQSASAVTDADSVAITLGIGARVKAARGSWVMVAEHDLYGKIIGLHTAKAGVDIEPDVYYTIIEGRFVRCRDSESH